MHSPLGPLPRPLWIDVPSRKPRVITEPHHSRATSVIPAHAGNQRKCKRARHTSLLITRIPVKTQCDTSPKNRASLMYSIHLFSISTYLSQHTWLTTSMHTTDTTSGIPTNPDPISKSTGSTSHQSPSSNGTPRCFAVATVMARCVFSHTDTLLTASMLSCSLNASIE